MKLLTAAETADWLKLPESDRSKIGKANWLRARGVNVEERRAEIHARHAAAEPNDTPEKHMPKTLPTGFRWVCDCPECGEILDGAFCDECQTAGEDHAVPDDAIIA